MGQTRKWLGILGALMLATCGCYAQEQDDKVRSRLKEMKGDDDQAAMVAEMELAAMGDKALEPLRKIVDDEKDPMRAEAMKVYPRALEKAGRLTRVTLDFDDARIGDVMMELNKQCKAIQFFVSGTDLGNRQITIHRDKAPYCLALAEICQMADVSLDDNYQAKMGRIRSDRGSSARPISEQWGNVVILDSIRMRSTMDYERSSRNGPNLELTMKVILDPLTQSLMRGGVKDVEATDEAGVALKLTPKSDVMNDDRLRGTVKTRTFSLAAPQESKKIARLKGKLMEYIGYDTETWTINDIAKAGGTSHDFGAMKTEIRSAAISGESLTLEMSVSGIPLPGGSGWSDNSNYHLLQSLIRTGMQVESNEGKDNWYTYTTTFKSISPMMSRCDFTVILKNPNGKPAGDVKMRLEFPKKFEEAWIGFEFKDIELFQG